MAKKPKISGKNGILKRLIRERYGNIGRAANLWGVSRVSIHTWIRRGIITYNGAQIIRRKGIKLTGFPVESTPNKGGRPPLSHQ